MPNWSYNRLSISASKKAMAEFYSEAIKDGTFQMSNIFPMPEKIKNTVSPSSSAKGKKWMNEDAVSANREGEISKLLGEEPTGLIPCENNTPEKCDALIKEYGADNWYDWNIAAYGTKWDLQAMQDFDMGDTEFFICFNTAWVPPMRFFERLQKRFPDIDISLVFEIEGDDICGKAYTERSEDDVWLEVEESEILCHSADGRPIFFDGDVWCYEDTGEECEELCWINPFDQK